MNKINHNFLTILILVTVLIFGSAFNPAVQNEDDEDLQIKITQVDTTAFPKVKLYVSIVDSSDEPVGVDPSRLRIEENGTEISRGDIQGFGDVGPMTTMLVMDISGSMEGGDKLSSAKEVAKDFINQMRPQDQAGLITFNTEVLYVQSITTNKTALIEAVDGLKGQGDTAMYDALALAVKILDPIPGRKAIIALTDGLDNRSSTTPDEVIESIGIGGLSISTIGLGNAAEGPGVLTALDEEALKNLADQAGGRYGYADDKQSLQELYSLYQRILQSEYVIEYISPSSLRDGVNRDLSVSLSSSGSGDALKAEQVVYNPGGLVPEVAEPAPWPLFFAILGGLVLLLLIPFGIIRIMGGRKNPTTVGKQGKKKQRSKIKLK